MNDKQSLILELKNIQQKTVDLVCTLTEDQLSIPYHPGANPMNQPWLSCISCIHFPGVTLAPGYEPQKTSEVALSQLCEEV